LNTYKNVITVKCVADIHFEWDEAKNLANQRKHGVSFEEARQVFLDPLSFSLLERIERGEERWQTFGMVDGVLLLMVVHTFREEEDAVSEVVRIISARRANRRERRRYEDEDRSV
jgi:uncharacterized DUF497 family protein